MTGIAVVASAHDAKFAEEVRAALQAAGLDASVSQTLPKVAGPHVVLIWSAELAADHAIDAQALIGLWSEDRLLVARRDATRLPLGLRDLPSLPPGSTAADICAAVPGVRDRTAGHSAAPELKQLGRYDLTSVLGKGAMGIVYEGMDPKLHRKVAIKTILKGHMDDDEAAKEYSMRFMREAQAVARLNHPHIVQVYDFGEEKDVAYIVMEFIKGKELKNFFDANERFELKEAVRIMCELLDALDFAHEGGIVHRDIKPANVMLDGQARVKLADFGVAQFSNLGARTPAYMSPEQITGGNVDRRSDIFSAGIILYQFLTGEKPFTGSGAWTIAKKIIQDHPPVPSSINNTISPLFDNVVNKALSKTVDGRYQTAKEFAAALRRALEGKSDEDESDKTVVGSMGDLSRSAKPTAQVAGAMATATEGNAGAGSQGVELEFWRAIKDGNDPDDFELYIQQFPTGIYAALAKRKLAKLRGIAPEDTGAKAREQEKKEAEEAAKREAEVKRKLADEKAKLEALLSSKQAVFEKSVLEGKPRLDAAALAAKAAKPEPQRKKEPADAPKAKMPTGVLIGAIVAIALAGGGAWHYFNKTSLEKPAALTAALESAAKASEELKQAHVRELEALKALEQARAAEDTARTAGDPAKLKEAQEAAKRAEAEASKQAEVVKAREAAAADARNKAQDASATAKKEVAKAAAPEKKEEFPAPAVVAEAPKAELPQSETATAQFEPAAKAEAPKAVAKSPMSRSEREQAADEEAARAAATRLGAERPPVASASPSAPAPAEAQSTSAPDHDALYQQAVAMEKAGRGAESIRIYRRAARAGSGKAAKRLGEIYDRGIEGVSRDYAESLQWYETARQLGETIAMAGGGGRGPAVAPSPARPAPEVAAKSAPPRLEPAPAPAPAPAAIPEPPKAAPVPPPVQAPEPPKAAAEPVAQAPESKSGWFSMRGLLIALLVLALIVWRRARRREKALARQSQPRSAAATDSSRAQAAVLVAALSESAKLDRAAIAACLRIVRECTRAAGGNVINTAGDRVMSSFPSADAAADAAIEMQAAVNALEPVGNIRSGIRIGFNYGPIVEQADGDVFGDAVNVAARLSHIAVKGQIITARDTVMLMSPMLKSATRKLTSIQIKGRAAEVEVYELMWQQSEDATTMAAARSVYKPKKTALKLVLRGKEHVLADEITAVSIGREEPADLVIEDPMASRSHGKIERRLDKFVLTDHSANGTFVMVEGEREIVLRREEFTLRGRGWIAFGQSKTTATDILEYYCEQSVSSPDATLFVSYSHKDRSRVEPIVSVIEEMGRRVWMDRSDITGQTGWAGQIVRAIRECRAVVLMASPNSYNSDQVVRELYLAMNHRKTIVPIEIEPAEMPDELQYILAPFQHHRLSGRETREVIGRALAAV